jgi:hypothetical protein
VARRLEGEVRRLRRELAGELHAKEATERFGSMFARMRAAFFDEELPPEHPAGDWHELDYESIREQGRRVRFGKGEDDEEEG